LEAAGEMLGLFSLGGLWKLQSLAAGFGNGMVAGVGSVWRGPAKDSLFDFDRRE